MEIKKITFILALLLASMSTYAQPVTVQNDTDCDLLVRIRIQVTGSPACTFTSWGTIWQTVVPGIPFVYTPPVGSTVIGARVRIPPNTATPPCLGQQLFQIGDGNICQTGCLYGLQNQAAPALPPCGCATQQVVNGTWSCPGGGVGNLLVLD